MMIYDTVQCTVYCVHGILCTRDCVHYSKTQKMEQNCSTQITILNKLIFKELVTNFFIITSWNNTITKSIYKYIANWTQSQKWIGSAQTVHPDQHYYGRQLPAYHGISYTKNRLKVVFPFRNFMVSTVHLGNIVENSREGSGAIVGLKGRNLEGVVLTLSLLGYLKTRICWGGQFDPPPSKSHV